MKLRIALGLTCALAGFAGGTYWTHAEGLAQLRLAYLGAEGRVLSHWPGKTEIPCPDQTARTAVFLVFGQSNAGNYQGQRHQAIDSRVVNFFNGKCTIAASPLLGSEGEKGESWTLLGNELIENGTFDRVIIAPAVLGGTEISEWSDGDAGKMLVSTAAKLSARYHVTAVLMHQGERDFAVRTSAADYEARLRKIGAELDAPMFVSVASYATRYAGWAAVNPVTTAQREIVDGVRFLAGPDTDSLLDGIDRFDGTHFGASGQEKFAAEFARILAEWSVPVAAVQP